MWEKAFSEVPGLFRKNESSEATPLELRTIEQVKSHFDWLHIKHCLLKPYFETEEYPLVESRELLPSFEVDLYEYKALPGFTAVVFERPLSSFQEIFQYDSLHSLTDWQLDFEADACSLEGNVSAANTRTFLSRLPKRHHAEFVKQMHDSDICALENYENMLPFLLELERAHIIAHDSSGAFGLQGIYASLPSNLDSELKQFGLKIGKFKPGDSFMYECNRLFVYHFLMELHGFPIVSERRTSAAMFARRLLRQGERFMIRVLGQSDRTITTFTSPLAVSARRRKAHPKVEKIALVQVNENQTEAIALLKDQGFFVDEKKRVVILRVTYQQHDYNSRNIREDRALSVRTQEVIHPITGRILDHLNIIQDVQNMILRLNDIVRGEFKGTVNYKRRENVTDTDTHEKRLKFLFSWLSKHMHRIIDYSDEYYAQVVRVLDGYLLAPDNYDVFNELFDLHQEVWSKYSQIQQARKIRALEDLHARRYKGERIGYRRTLELMTSILNELKFEIVNYFDKFVAKVLVIGEDMVSDRYLQRNYVEKKDEELSAYGLETKRLYYRLVALLDEFRSIRKSRMSTGGTRSIGF
ncbi:hypothetical protein [Pseudodesulfovibrio tunisiensis]|uniref:hypothetical protein n=1 Tax=Pseudodesulfovibrio tunisiensis TaxID=463192 RepID=UPI001FB25061|nr:hypothetical protein [Pseudodesulfovibrio tunisiensis]